MKFKTKYILLTFSILISILLLFLPYAEEFQLNGNSYSPPQFSRIIDKEFFYSLNWLDYFSVFFSVIVTTFSIIIHKNKILNALIIIGLLLDAFAIGYLYFLTMDFCVCRITIEGYAILGLVILQFLWVLILLIKKIIEKVNG